MRLLFDLSSVLHTGLRKGKDKEGREVLTDAGKRFWINSAMYGYENAVGHIVDSLQRFEVQPKDVIIVAEGLNTKAPRLAINSLYKSNREDTPMAYYEEFAKLRDMVVPLLRSIGCIVMVQDNAEGDDSIAWLCKHLKDKYIVVSTNDGDMTVLNGTNEHGSRIDVCVEGVLGVNKYGDFPFEYITLYKALVGDYSDKVSGIVGFGKKAWQQFHKTFGIAGMKYLTELAEQNSLDSLEGEAKQDKMIEFIFNNRYDFLRAYRTVKLHPEWVNTLTSPVQWLPGMCVGAQSDERLEQYQASRTLVTADNWEKVMPRVVAAINKLGECALDIETSTPPESDDWLAAMEDPEAVDVMGSKLTGMSLTFGVNNQHTIYISVDHADTANVSSKQVFEMIKQLKCTFVIHNTMFEGPVLFNEWGAEWLDNGFEGFLPNWLDTKFEASYVDENFFLGLKPLSKRWLNYEQVDYKTTTTVSVPHGQPSQGRFLGTINKNLPTLNADGTPGVSEGEDRYAMKMNMLTAKHVFDYACDDTMTTAALHNFFKLVMQLESTWDTYLKVEIDASYGHAQSYVNGVDISLSKLAEVVAEDDQAYDKARAALDQYLIANGWEGSICPQFEVVDATAIKTAYQIVTGEVLPTKYRIVDKVIATFAEEQPVLAQMCTDVQALNSYVKQKFTAAPSFNSGSPKQMNKLMFEVMGLTPRVFNKPTDKMKAEGLKVGTPKTDALAIAYGMMDADEALKATLTQLRIMKMVETRHGLYYDTYPYFVHWKTGKVHSNHNQCATNTRRASSSKPNLQQLSKHEKLEGFSPRVRELIIPHKKNAVVVSMDFASQELRVIADYSQDANMLACFVGEPDTLKDMHCLTGVGIAQNLEPAIEWDYELLNRARSEKVHPLNKVAKEARNLGKKVNFTTEYGAQAPKVAVTLLITEDQAQKFIDAREAAFPRAAEWKQEVIEEARYTGIVHTKGGAVRHLAAALTSSDRYVSSKAERQAVNTKIQGSSAEMTKLAEGRMFKARLEQRFDAKIIGPVHDEVVASVAIEDLVPFCKAMHACMVDQYADMQVPVRSSISFGPNFGVQIECGEEPTEEAIAEGLEEYYKLIGKVSAPAQELAVI